MNNLLNIKSFLNFLKRNKAYTAIEVFGLSISLMFVIIIAAYTVQELSVDNFHEKKDRIYVLANEENFGSAYRIADRLIERYPEIEKICPTVSHFKKWPTDIADKKFNADLVFVSDSFWDIFSFQLNDGNRNSVFAAKNDAVISESFARKVFQDKDPMGQTLQLNDSVAVTVNGVMKDIKNSTVPYGDIILRIENIKYFNWSLDNSVDYSNAGSVPIFILAKEGADLKAKEGDALAYLKEFFWIYKNGIHKELSFIPLKDVYFSKIKGYFGFLLKQGEWTFVMILMSVGILILLFAIINYINLTVAQTGFRAKEMATRRLLGSSRGELFLRLIMESTLLCLLSFIIGLALAFGFAQYAGNILDTKIDILDVFKPIAIVVGLSLVVMIGAISGLLPAVVISRVKPIDAVKGALKRKTKMTYSKVLITFQNAITIALVAASITMVLQTEHLIGAPLGYNTTNIINIPLEDRNTKKNATTLGKEFAKLATVNRVALSAGTPFDGGNNYTMRFGDRNIAFQALEVDSVFMGMYGLEIIRDNHVADKEGWYVSQKAIKELEIEEDASSFKFYDKPTPIRGIVKDFQLRSITTESRPILVKIRETKEHQPWWNISVEVKGDPFAAYDQVKDVYEKFTQLEFTGKFTDQLIEESFATQKRISKILLIFSSIAIILSLLGLLAMSTYYIQQRNREIAVRKVFGSTNSEVLQKLVLTFLNYVIIAFVIITPVIWYVLKEWLSDYSYRISLNPMIFITAGLFCLIISFLTVFWQSYVAANENPAVKIKSE